MHLGTTAPEPHPSDAVDRFAAAFLVWGVVHVTARIERDRKARRTRRGLGN